MNIIEEILKLIIPKAHWHTCPRCHKSVHPWDDYCLFCGIWLNWENVGIERMSEPDWYSRTFERETSYARWLAKRN